MYVRSFAYFFMIKHQLYSNSEVDMLLYTSENRYDNSTKEASFSVGLQGVQHNDVDAVKNIIWNTLEKVSREGFAQERVSSVLHQIELGLKHQTSKFGLSLIMVIEFATF
jgi:Zn-dependent M16 (insulinase) family peptidase